MRKSPLARKIASSLRLCSLPVVSLNTFAAKACTVLRPENSRVSAEWTARGRKEAIRQGERIPCQRRAAVVEHMLETPGMAGKSEASTGCAHFVKTFLAPMRAMLATMYAQKKEPTKMLMRQRTSGSMSTAVTHSHGSERGTL